VQTVRGPLKDAVSWSLSLTHVERKEVTEMSNEGMLGISLSAAVPLWIEELKDREWEYIMKRARECSQVIAEKGDIILYKSKKPGGSAEAFNRMAEGVACLAFCLGGVTLFGQHWEAKLGESYFHQVKP